MDAGKGGALCLIWKTRIFRGICRSGKLAARVELIGRHRQRGRDPLASPPTGRRGRIAQHHLPIDPKRNILAASNANRLLWIGLDKSLKPKR
jgi:hypothetical protein